jgi:hypothetical protein
VLRCGGCGCRSTAPLHFRSVRGDELTFRSSTPIFGSTTKLQHIRIQSQKSFTFAFLVRNCETWASISNLVSNGRVCHSSTALEPSLSALKVYEQPSTTGAKALYRPTDTDTSETARSFSFQVMLPRGLLSNSRIRWPKEIAIMC